MVFPITLFRFITTQDLNFSFTLFTFPRLKTLLSRVQETTALGLDPVTSHWTVYSWSATIWRGLCGITTLRGRTVKGWEYLLLKFLRDGCVKTYGEVLIVQSSLRASSALCCLPGTYMKNWDVLVLLHLPPNGLPLQWCWWHPPDPLPYDRS